MSDYSWIQPGVKAIICGASRYPELIGEVITIIDPNYAFTDYLSGKESVAVKVEEGRELAKLVGIDFNYVTVDRDHIKPFEEDDKNATGSWEEITKIIGVDIREQVPA